MESVALSPERSEFVPPHSSGLGICGIVVPEGAGPREAYAIGLPCTGVIIPAVSLRVAGARWHATACVLQSHGLAEMVSERFLSVSVTALLKMNKKAFATLLDEPQKAQARFDYLCSTGEQFLPVPPDKDNWEIACRWPDWQRRRRSYIERAHEWARDHRVPVNTAGELERLAAYLRQRWRRMGLRISDTSDV